MQVTVTLDDELLDRLQRFTGVSDPAKLIDAGLRLVIAHATMHRLTSGCESGDSGESELRGVLTPDR
jgi:hypothetical protein